jgi:hypothetical protein
LDEISFKVLSAVLVKQEPSMSVVDELFILVDQINTALREEQYLPRLLAGKLFYLYIQIEGETRYIKDHRNPIFMLQARLQSYLSDIYGRKW